MSDKSQDPKEMSILQHLGELRRRMLVSLAAILVATCVALIFSGEILKLFLVPAGGMHLKAFSLLDGFMIRFKISLYAGVAATFPVWIYQAYSFVRPGLYVRERKVVFPMLFGSLVLFILGMVFAYSMLSSMVRVMIQIFPSSVDLLPSADSYISFVTFFLLACGLVFQLPTVLIALVQLHIISTRLLRKQRRIAYFLLFAFAEIITPVSDPIVAPLTVMVPLVVLYEISIFLGRRIEARRERAQALSQEAGPS
jgi:sec-independent protein translocase protein TatC